MDFVCKSEEKLDKKETPGDPKICIGKARWVSQYCPGEKCNNRSLYELYKNDKFFSHRCEDHIKEFVSNFPNKDDLLEIIEEWERERQQALGIKTPEKKRELLTEMNEKPVKRRLFAE